MSHRFLTHSTNRAAMAPLRLRSLFASGSCAIAALFLSLPSSAQAADPVADLVAAPLAKSAADAIAVNIDGRLVESDPTPLLDKGAVYVPLRGVLESLGAKVNYVAADKRIEIEQGGKNIILRAGQSGATVGTEIVDLAPPKIVAGRAFVPLRALAELFGYRVAWLGGARTVAIYTNEGIKAIPADHRKALEAGGPFGIQIDFTEAPIEDVPILLDAAKKAGAGIVKTRFDWQTLEPEKGGDFQWPIYDRIVKEARERGLIVVGVLGDSTKWASVSSSSDPDEWRQSPPREKEFPAWSNYVKRVVGRYKNDVQAWQVWENPMAGNFRSVPRNYRKLARLAVDAARESDPKAIVHAAEPGGVSLQFISDLTANGLTPHLDGVAVYPVSQWRPGTTNPTENFLLPYATLQDQLRLKDGKTRDYWVGGLSYPTLEIASQKPPTAETTPVAALPNDLNKEPAKMTEAPPTGLLKTFSPQAQADYLVRAMSLGLASGTEKVFWSRLRDPQDGGRLQPLDPQSGTGLLRADNSPRPSYLAYSNLTKQLGAKPYAGNLALGRDVVALLFDDKKAGVLVAWSPSGNGTLALSPLGVDARVPDATYVATRADSLVLDATGKAAGAPEGVLKLSDRPIFITNVAADTAKLASARANDKPLKLTPGAQSFAESQSVEAIFEKTSGENGISFRKYADYGGQARNFSSLDGKVGLATESQRNILDLTSSRPFIYLDVADDFLFFQRGVPVEVIIEVHRPPVPTSTIFTTKAGFQLEYDGKGGTKSTPWREVEPGEGWETFTITLPDASFGNKDGYDLLINAAGSKADLVFHSVTIKKLEQTP